jgi:glycosyltransferase involved in cell wall biosynthesis
VKILHLIYTHGVSGAEKYLLDLLPGLKKYGISCDVICVCPRAHRHKVQEYCDRLKADGIATKLIASSRLNIVGVAKKIDGYCRANDIRVIHSHLFNSDVIAVAVKMLFNKKIKLLSTKHGYKESYFINNTEGFGRIPYNPYYFLTKFVISKIDKNITISKAISDLYHHLKLTPDKMPFIHHGIHVDKKLIKDPAVQYRRSTPQLVIVGRLAEIKGHTYLFDAMPEIIEKFPAVQLLVMGEGVEQA